MCISGGWNWSRGGNRSLFNKHIIPEMIPLMKTYLVTWAEI